MKVVGKAIVISLSVLLISCLDKGEEPNLAVQNEVNEFVWGGLNSWYFWQNEVESLADNRFGSFGEKNQFLNFYTSPVQLFETLRHPDDRFSWIVDDYVALNQSFQGISKSFGYEFSLIEFEGQVLAYVEYVIPGSPADLSNLKRGDIISTVDGNDITSENYLTLFFSSENYTLSLADIVDNEIVLLDIDLDMTAVTIVENPVLYSGIIEYNGRNVGYIVYNRFTHTFHSELNAAFGEYTSAGVDELVLDLRYNPGGAVFTSGLLASLIYSDGQSSDLFTRLAYNNKHSAFNQDFNFQESVDILNGDFDRIATENRNALDLERIYILTGRATASASELLITGLEPYMEVIQIGSVTRGKNEGSITLYDAPITDYISRQNANPNHRWAMQPIVFRLFNAEGFGEYSDGLVPDIELVESDFFTDLKPLGDEEEVLLNAALLHISGEFQGSRFDSHRYHSKVIFNSRLANPHSEEMYVNGLLRN